ncbi:hypothetical protein FHS42_003918 [Streptomyces zagrosensis]|uniref:Uncharacterized protein n=1 Tax=Streptomyces zagrosensis TaxID=1042984 RepID=A0A7W9V006_9ACTN|nr:hypothetical protein [Streptomyces zagrosensis]
MARTAPALPDSPRLKAAVFPSAIDVGAGDKGARGARMGRTVLSPEGGTKREHLRRARVENACMGRAMGEHR